MGCWFLTLGEFISKECCSGCTSVHLQRTTWIGKDLSLPPSCCCWGPAAASVALGMAVDMGMDKSTGCDLWRSFIARGEIEVCGVMWEQFISSSASTTDGACCHGVSPSPGSQTGLWSLFHLPSQGFAPGAALWNTAERKRSHPTSTSGILCNCLETQNTLKYPRQGPLQHLGACREWAELAGCPQTGTPWRLKSKQGFRSPFLIK